MVSSVASRITRLWSCLISYFGSISVSRCSSFQAVLDGDKEKAVEIAKHVLHPAPKP